jgi:hypothetical protein
MQAKGLVEIPTHNIIPNNIGLKPADLIPLIGL